MSIGLIALLDDVAALAKASAASLDDVATQAAKAGAKVAGVVIDDAAVTPGYVTGLSPARELAIIWQIVLGSLRNKLIILLPVALALSVFLPQVIPALLMLGGFYLCYEGAEKIIESVSPHEAAHDAEAMQAIDAQTFEDATVAGAIRTDFILSAEIMTIALSSVPGLGLATQAAVLAIVGVGITVAVYGAVALIVKADDFGLALAKRTPITPVGEWLKPFGRGLVKGMPYFLTVLGVVGTAAMVWVGGGIILHGLETYGFAMPAHLLAAAGEAAAEAFPQAGGFVQWLVEAVGAGIAGVAIGMVAAPIASHVVMPIWNAVASRFGGREA